MARSRRSPLYKASRERVKQNLARKRQSAAILRRAGLIKRTAAQVDTKYLKSSYFRELRRRYADVIEGSSKTTMAESNIARVLKAAGYRVKRGAAGTFQVVVPAEAKPKRKLITRKQATELAQRPAPVSPKPVKPRPSRAGKPPAPGKPHSFDDCLKAVIAWFRLNADARNGPWAQREQDLITLAMTDPDTLRAILRASHNDGLRFLHGQGQRWQRRYPRTQIGIDFRTYFPELQYYHPTTTNYLTVGGLIPKC
jgi:hypothetical protein